MNNSWRYGCQKIWNFKAWSHFVFQKRFQWWERICLHSFELKNWFEGYTNRWFCIEIRICNRPRCLKFTISIIIMNLDTKSTIRASFKSIFRFEMVRTYPAPSMTRLCLPSFFNLISEFQKSVRPRYLKKKKKYATSLPNDSDSYFHFSLIDVWYFFFRNRAYYN
jgi:hypothetical protein